MGTDVPGRGSSGTIVVLQVAVHYCRYECYFYALGTSCQRLIPEGYSDVERSVDSSSEVFYNHSVSILLTGFEPWGKELVNPSGELARELGGHVLPVDFHESVRRLKDLIARHRPDAVVMLGLSSTRTKINLEAVALNVDPREGKTWRRGIARRGPLAIESRLPLDRLLAALKKARVPATISHHAGTYVCNHLFYEALRGWKKGPCGFIHVPTFKAMSKPRQLRAIRAVLAALDGSSPAARR